METHDIICKHMKQTSSVRKSKTNIELEVKVRTFPGLAYLAVDWYQHQDDLEALQVPNHPSCQDDALGLGPICAHWPNWAWGPLGPGPTYLFLERALGSFYKLCICAQHIVIFVLASNKWTCLNVCFNWNLQICISANSMQLFRIRAI